LNIQYKVDINPSYEWAEEASTLNISHRELEVLALVVEGYKNKEIAQILKIKHQSVKNHLQHLFKKLSVKNNTQAYIIALQMKLIKTRAAMLGYENYPALELTADSYIDGFRKLLNSENPVAGVSEKDKRKIKVFLKEHGIDPENW